MIRNEIYEKNEAIKLKKVRLIQWYELDDVQIQIGKNITLLSGENQAGKSVILDGIRYCIDCDSNFNPSAADKKSERTIKSYVRGLIKTSLDKTKMEYLRNDDTTSHILAEFFDEERNVPFVVGVISDFYKKNDTINTHRYLCEGKKIEDILCTIQEDENTFVLNYEQFKKENRDIEDNFYRFDTVWNAKNQIYRRLGLILTDDSELERYNTVRKNILTYKPSNFTSVNDFIRTKLLPEKRRGVIKVGNQVKALKEAGATFERLIAEENLIDRILHLQNKYSDYNKKLEYNQYKACYSKVNDNKTLIQSKTNKNQELCINFETKKAELNQLKTVQTTKNVELSSIRDQMIGNDTYNQIKRNEVEIEQKNRLLNEKRTLINDFQNLMEEIENVPTTLQDELRRINDAKLLNFVQFFENLNFKDSTSYKEKKIVVQEVQNKLKELNNYATNQSSKQKIKIEEIEQEISDIQKQYNEINDKATYTSNPAIRDAVMVCKEINDEFKKANISSCAKMAYEFVENIKDNEWRMPLESILGNRRFQILVEPKYWAIADKVAKKFQQTKNNNFVLANTTRLMSREIHVSDNSATTQLMVENPIAKSYFNYHLRNVILATDEDCIQYDHFITKSGKISTNLGVRYKNDKDVAMYCLGFESLQITKKALHKKMGSLRDKWKKEKDKLDDLSQIEYSAQDLYKVLSETHLSYLETYQNLPILIRQLNDLNELQARLNAQLKQVDGYISLQEKESQLSNEIFKIEQNIYKKNDELGELKGMITTIEVDLESLKEKSKTIIQEWLNLKQLNVVLAEKVEKEFKTNQHLLNDEEKAKIEKNLSDVTQQFYGELSKLKEFHNDILELNHSIQDLEFFQKRKATISANNKEIAKQNIHTEEKRLETLMCQEFAYGVYDDARVSKTHCQELNKTLAKLPFTKRYAIHREKVKDPLRHSIYKLGEYQYKQPDRDMINFHQIDLLNEIDYDKETRECNEHYRIVVNALTEILDDPNFENILTELGDYRTYFNYDVDVLDCGDNVIGKLSTDLGKASGGEQQIPIYLLLFSSLIMQTNYFGTHARIVFCDEPFTKTGAPNIVKFIKFLKEENFQVVFASSEKIDSIGQNADSLLTVYKDIENNSMIVRNHRMETHTLERKEYGDDR